jgi:hypothetical protein
MDYHAADNDENVYKVSNIIGMQGDNQKRILLKQATDASGGQTTSTVDVKSPARFRNNSLRSKEGSDPQLVT